MTERLPFRTGPNAKPTSAWFDPETATTSGSRLLGRRTVTCFSALDNLIKGGAGQAIQNMNLLLGCDERASLEDVGNWP